MEPAELGGAFVIAADDVARYLDRHKNDLTTFEIITNVAPPLPLMFIEFRSVGFYKERHGLHSWGVLVEGDDLKHLREGPEDRLRWSMRAQVIFEPRKNDACGPLAVGHCFVLEDGRLERESERGRATGQWRWTPMLPNWIEDPVDKFTKELELGLWELTVPALFTLSLLHCRNVTATPVEPEPKLDKEFSRRHGVPLTRYHVLNIEPMRQILDSEGHASSKGLGHALHVCRGHFKRYSEDGALFGRYTGQFWWSAHRRGRAEVGVVDKDYRILAGGFGREYQTADEHPELETTGEARVRDPDSAGRGLRAHNITQNAFAKALEGVGLIPRSPTPKEPPYDLGWETREHAWIAEVKSLSPTNEEQQLRAALSQLLRYRQALAAAGHGVRTVLVGEREPTDSTWLQLLADEHIEVTWPAAFAEFVVKCLTGSPSRRSPADS